ncbi:zinc finger and BTB domain-containing protein 8A isoform X1 [Acipenser ruthenus]|uniref:zinc finger and BTB domain-containing protein 8A isoform X1 n=2 Tax=Acipenser ruthenus TaxID=7906 RepID=UPI0027409E32|nr:zinc finger and BTB domain-containing protein 8A isoform X1 [Acipenser ruthenus]
MDMLTDMRGKGSSGEHGLQGQQRVPCSSSSPSEISSSHQSRLLQQLDQQRRQGLFCDCSVLVEGRLFQAHRNVLFASSGYFRMLLSSGAQGGGAQPVGASFEVFSPEIFSVILDFVYSGRLELRSDNVIEVMSAASYLQMTDVIGYCKGFIRSSLDISAKDEKEDEEQQQQQRYPAPSSGHTGAPHASFSCATSWRVQNGSGAQQDYRHQQQQQKDQPPPPSKHPLPQEGMEFRPGKPRSSRQPLHTSLGGLEGDAAVLQFSPGSEGGGGGTAATGRKKKGWTPAPPPAALSPPDHKGAPPSSSSSSPSPSATSSSSSSKPKADKADELYATLPTIVGVVGLFNQDECPSMRFKCPFCTHTVKRKADLKRHLRCHTGERPYPCEACGKRFTRLEHLRSHFQTIHQAQKLICRKCKRHVTELSGRVVCEGTRRYRLCNDCLLETGCDTPGSANHSAAEPCFEDDEGLSWPMTDEDELAEDSGADLIIQEVEDSDEEMDRKEVKPVIG